MEKLLKMLTEKEKELLNKIVKHQDDMADVEVQLADYMMLHCLTDDDGLTPEGIMCETILNKLGNLDQHQMRCFLYALIVLVGAIPTKALQNEEIRSFIMSNIKTIKNG